MTTKKLLSIILSLVMILSITSVAASADTDDKIINALSIKQSNFFI